MQWVASQNSQQSSIDSQTVWVIMHVYRGHLTNHIVTWQA